MIDDGLNDVIAEALGRSLGTLVDNYISLGALHQIDEVLWSERGKPNVSICKLWLERKQATFCMCKYEELWLQREQVKFCISR